MWTWDSTEIDFSQTCWTFDGSNNCQIMAGSGYPVIIYHTLPIETVKEVAKKVKKYQKVEKKRVISPEAIKAIVEVMVDTWSKDDMQQKMDMYHITRDRAIESYKKTIRLLIQDEDLSLILILASI